MADRRLYQRDRQNIYYWRRREAGHCVKCGEPSRGFSRCERCRLRRRRLDAARRRARPFVWPANVREDAASTERPWWCAWCRRGFRTALGVLRHSQRTHGIGYRKVASRPAARGTAPPAGSPAPGGGDFPPFPSSAV